jgi:hypothetical protein
VNHSGRCLYISTGHPGSRNDKTTVKTDKLVMDLRDFDILQDVEFKLYKVYNPYRTQVLMLPLLLISLYQLLISLYLLLISLYLLLISLYQLLTSLYLLLISLYLFSYDLLPDSQFS